METIDNLPVQMPNSLESFYQAITRTETLPEKQASMKISIYKGTLSDKVMAQQAKRLQVAFPALSTNYFVLLRERLVENGFSDKRLTDAINNVIDNYMYPTPTIASVVNFDRTVKTYTREEMLKLNSDNPGIMARFVSVDTGLKFPVYVSMIDFEKHGLKKWEVKPR